MASATNTVPTETHPRRLLLVSVPRSASNLLVKILNIYQQPNVHTNEKGGYFFFEAFAANRARLSRPIDQWPDTETTQSRDLYQQCLDRLEECSAQARGENKIMFAKEHAFWFANPAAGSGLASSFRLKLPASYGPEQTFSQNNETLFSDQYLRTWQLAFIIRHPALAWPSLYRAMLKISSDVGDLDNDGLKGVSTTNMSYAWTRKLFDWGLEHSDKEARPLVIDAYDVIHNPSTVVRFCEAIGLDPEAVRLEWESGPGELDKLGGHGGDPKHRQMALIMLSTLLASNGIVKDKTPATVDIKAEAAKWRDEFGDAAERIEKAVWDSMPDYEYLWERRLTC